MNIANIFLNTWHAVDKEAERAFREGRSGNPLDSQVMRELIEAFPPDVTVGELLLAEFAYVWRMEAEPDVTFRLNLP